MRLTKKAGKASVKRVGMAAALGVLAIALAYAQSGSVRFHGTLSRVVTPNGDGVNDLVFFCFENPQDTDISGKVYGLLGGEVGVIGARRDRTGAAGSGCPASVVRAQYATWDANAPDRIRSGLYVYRINAAEQVFTGTVFVVR